LHAIGTGGARAVEPAFAPITGRVKKYSTVIDLP
jgi:hypothetical protein